MNILLSSAGRRGALVRLLQQEAAHYGGKVFAVDAGDCSSACRLASDWVRVPRCNSPQFVNAIIDYCRARDIQLIIPTIDPELPVYAEHRAEIEAAGIGVCISSPETVAISADKDRTDAFFQAAGLPTVNRYELSAAARGEDINFPVIVKPRFGSASQSVNRAVDAEELAFYLKRTPQPIVQQEAIGNEFTVNFFVGRDGRCHAAVPHQRIATRGGEVSHGVTIRNPELMEIAEQMAAALPGAWGAMCYQAFVSPEGAITLIELNARFGGGYPLAHAAGANFIQWLIHDRIGQPIPNTCSDWQEGMVMSRWDDAAFWVQEHVQRAAA